MTPKRPRFSGRPVGKQRTRRFMLAVGSIGVVVLLLMGILSFRVADTVPGRSYYDVFAEFDEADNLANHYEVRIGGRRAGQILDPEVVDGKARVQVRLDEEFGPLRSDTTTRVRLRSAVGVRYLEITPGTKGRFLEPNETIPAENQTDSVPLDAVLGTFDPETREGLKFFLSEFGGAFAGNGEPLNAALGSATPFFEDLKSVSKAITDEPGAMRNLIRGAGRTAATFEAVRSEIASGFEPIANGARAFADTREGFSSSLNAAPPALDTLSARLPAVAGLVREVGGLAREGRTTLDLAPSALAATDRMLVDARPALDDADKTLDIVREATPSTVEVLQRLEPELPDARDLFASLSPTVKYLAPRQCEIVNLTTGWANDLKWGTTRGSMVNFYFQAFFGQLDRGGILQGQTETSILGNRELTEELAGISQSTPYPGPCANGEGNTGPEGVTVEESAQGLKYTYNRPPGVGLTGRTTP